MPGLIARIRDSLVRWRTEKSQRLFIGIGAATVLILLAALFALGQGGRSRITADDLGPGAEPSPGEAGSAIDEAEPGSGAAEAASKGKAAAKKAAGAAGGAFQSLVMGRGVTNTEIKIGVNITKNLDAAVTAVGAPSSSASSTGSNNEKPIVEAIVKYMNANGGIAGRKIVPIYYLYDAASNETWAAQAQAACSMFVEDEKVFAAVSGHVGGNDFLLACLAKGKTPLVQQNQWLYDAKYFADYAGLLYQPSRMRPERWGPAYVDGLHAQGYFDPGARVGLLKYDAPVFERAATIVRKRMIDRGLKFEDEVAITTPVQTSDLGQLNTELSNALLRFNTENIHHVMFVEAGGAIPFFMVTSAHSQGYQARYGMTSTNLLRTVATAAAAAPEQLTRAVGVSWLPGQDVFLPDDPRSDAAHKLCQKIMTDAGLTPFNSLYAGTHCDSFFFLKQALERATALTADGMSAAAGALGTTYVSPYTFTTKLGPGRFDGASSYRIAVFDDAAKNFKYVGDLKQAG